MVTKKSEYEHDQDASNRLLLDTIKFDKIFVLDGVGTIETTGNVINYNKYNASENPNSNIISKVGNYVYNTVKEAIQKYPSKQMDTLFGYSEDHHVVNLDILFDLVEYLSDNDEINLTIGGHSRGAALGMVVFLAALNDIYERQKQNDSENENYRQEKPVWEKVKHLRLIPTDPVQGNQKGRESTSDAGGLDPNYSVIDIIEKARKSVFISAETFEVIIFSARFDFRNPFKFDGKWKEFIDCRTLPSNISKTIFVAGFRHSAMVYRDEGVDLRSIYTNDLTPFSLLKEIINDTEGKDREQINRRYSDLHSHELDLAKRLKNFDTEKKIMEILDYNTKKDSYSAGFVYSSSYPLKDQLAHSSESSLNDKDFLLLDRYFSR
ncbi:hypothetical protein BTJ40_12935 [Microbulbifer sp. A4B17]|nr:hypothetical protein BTJ40_12935 [Microbulbifer sp. A4B17]